MLLSMLGEKPGARALAPLNVLVDLLVPGGWVLLVTVLGLLCIMTNMFDYILLRFMSFMLFDLVVYILHLYSYIRFEKRKWILKEAMKMLSRCIVINFACSVSYRCRIVVILGIIKVIPAIILMLTSDIKSGLQTVTRTEFHKMAKYANTLYAMLRPCIVLSEQPT